jgi:peptide-methionine (R)-S-oxide reductase
MKKRTFLTASFAWLGTTYFLNQWLRRTTVMAASQEQFTVTKTEGEWQKELTPEQFKVLRKHGTERAGSSPLDKQYGKGLYICAACDSLYFRPTRSLIAGLVGRAFMHPLKERSPIR